MINVWLVEEYYHGITYTLDAFEDMGDAMDYLAKAREEHPDRNYGMGHMKVHAKSPRDETTC